ncbi:three-helix bundle dimerization domain-containing protein [Pseudarthrobacter sulfonivorans]|uniref:three-helix bundle dimerization domain-containing protein n=1 Tax=Pseudarthrobacter sulfonivorans TaxID=121292 RepID=UPI0009F8A698|nr:hypothetical protein [Pseudarthrobacter sulfonivorans]
MDNETEEHLVTRVVERLAARYPEASRTLITEIVGEEYHGLDGGRIRAYVPTLVENGARTRLHRTLKNSSADG